jgi:hypothetical protein
MKSLEVSDFTLSHAKSMEKCFRNFENSTECQNEIAEITRLKDNIVSVEIFEIIKVCYMSIQVLNVKDFTYLFFPIV